MLPWIIVICSLFFGFYIVRDIVQIVRHVKEYKANKRLAPPGAESAEIKDDANV